MSQPPYQHDDTQPGNWGPPPPAGSYQPPSYTRPSGVPQSPAHQYSADPNAPQPPYGQPYGAQPYGDPNFAGQPYGQPYGAQPGWQEQQYGYPGYDPYGEPPRRGNGMAVAGFVLSFIFGLLGLIFSIIGLRKSREPGRTGRGLSIAGIVISVVNILAGILIAANLNSSSTLPASSSDTTNASGSSASVPAPAPGSESVADACHVIVPAVTGLQGDLQSASGPDDMIGKINSLADTVQNQGVASGDAAFTQDTANLANAYRTFLHALQSGSKPDVTTLYKSAEKIGYDCAKVGVTP